MTNTKSKINDNLKLDSTELRLHLTAREIELLRNSTSDLGVSDKNCLSLRLKIANAILDSRK